MKKLFVFVLVGMLISGCQKEEPVKPVTSRSHQLMDSGDEDTGPKLPPPPPPVPPVAG